MMYVSSAQRYNSRWIMHLHFFFSKSVYLCVCVCVCVQLLQDSMAIFNLDKSDRSKLHPHEQTDGTDRGADDELSTSYVCHRVSHADPCTSLLEILTGTIV